MSIRPEEVALIVPTLNAGRRWRDWLDAFARQSFKPATCIVVDSSSDDDTAALAQAAGFRVHAIPRAAFNHGGTRMLGIELLTREKFAVLMTQDAILADADALGRLVKAFQDERVGAAYGRQLPHAHTNPIIAHTRAFSYPPESSLCGREDIPRLGFRCAFLSNAFAAYRIAALHAAGGFPSNLIAMEDEYAAAKLILEDWTIAYRAEAQVYHAHDYRVGEEFKRYFDFGVFHAREAWLRRAFGQPEGEGARLVRAQMAYLLRHHPLRIPEAILRLAAKFAGFRLGAWEGILPACLKRRLSMHRAFWG